jgi:hypothetical protein
VKHRTQLEPALQRAPALLDPLLLVAEYHVFGAQRVVVAVHHELAVEAFERGDGLTVNRQAPPGVLEVATVALAAAQRADAHRVAIAVLRETGELGPELVQEFLAVGFSMTTLPDF